MDRYATHRLEGWEQRLDAVIEAARHRPYVLGEHDCFRVACQVIEALTGVDRWPQFSGYRTRREALARLAAHGSNFEAAGDWFFGSERVEAREARRGDIVALASLNGEKHLAVCMGAQSACLTDAGLASVPTAACICAWRIG